jgi:hypothetical protein
MPAREHLHKSESDAIRALDVKIRTCVDSSLRGLGFRILPTTDAIADPLGKGMTPRRERKTRQSAVAMIKETRGKSELFQRIRNTRHRCRRQAQIASELTQGQLAWTIQIQIRQRMEGAERDLAIAHGLQNQVHSQQSLIVASDVLGSFHAIRR